MTSEPTTTATTTTAVDADHDELDAVADRLVAQARTDGVALTGPGGLVGGLTKRVLEAGLAAELTDYLGDEPGDPRPGSNVRNGTTPKTVRTDIGQVRIDVPRHRQGTFEPAVLPKHVRRLGGFDEAVISLYAEGLTTGDIANHLADVYGDSASKNLVSKVTDEVTEAMAQWQSRPLDPGRFPLIVANLDRKESRRRTGHGTRRRRRLALRWSPAQISRWLHRHWPRRPRWHLRRNDLRGGLPGPRSQPAPADAAHREDSTTKRDVTLRLWPVSRAR